MAAIPPPLDPVILETAGLADYRLLDSGNGRKLERFGDMMLVRPEEQAIWSPRLGEAAWHEAGAVFTGDTDEEGAGRWKRQADTPDAWQCAHGPVRFVCRLTSFRHVGAFPEQAAHRAWMSERLARASASGRQPRLLNLFGYTGLASLIAADAGAHVTHVDASKKAIGWARENQSLSGMDDKPIRWICDDAMKFAAREVRRGKQYDGILLDPPKFGRGPKGETWDLFADLPGMLRHCRVLVDQKSGFVILTAYAIRASFIALHELTAEIFGEGVESGELVLLEESRDGQPGRRLPTSLFARWAAN
jgi:23S rRNA (cytosine1962-C5)-methyltransferase